jgi:hypothetical protein
LRVVLGNDADNYVIADAARAVGVVALQASGGLSAVQPKPASETSQASASLLDEAIAQWQAEGVDGAGAESRAGDRGGRVAPRRAERVRVLPVRKDEALARVPYDLAGGAPWFGRALGPHGLRRRRPGGTR